MTIESKLKMSLARKGRKQSVSHIKNRFKNVIGKKRFSVTGSNNPMYGKNHSEDTKEKIRKARVGKKMPSRSIEYRKKMSVRYKGENGPGWKGGITPINKIIRASSEYKLWRNAVFTRDKFTCIWCGTRFIKGITGDVILNADHIKLFALFPELRFAIDNGRTLCLPCHKTTDTYAGRIYPRRNK